MALTLMGGDQTKAIRLLVFDGLDERLEKFRVTGAPGYVAVLTSNLFDFKEKLRERGGYDLLMMTAYYGNGLWDMGPVMDAVKEAWKERRFRGVILYSPCEGDCRRQAQILRPLGIPVAMIPYNINNPSKHDRKEY